VSNGKSPRFGSSKNKPFDFGLHGTPVLFDVLHQIEDALERRLVAQILDASEELPSLRSHVSVDALNERSQQISRNVAHTGCSGRSIVCGES
jgi:hypothetical protein